VLDEFVAQLFWHYRYATGGVRLVLDDPEDSDEAETACVEYEASLNAAPRLEEPVKQWPLMLVLSLLVGAPFLLFGRKKGKLAATDHP
jgi:hypothetical protein